MIENWAIIMSKKAKISSKSPSKRQLRVGEEIRHVLAGLFIRQDIYVDELSGKSITVTEVSVSSDLSSAKVFIMPLGGQDIEIILPVLNKMAPFFAHQVSQKIHLKRMPKLSFLKDESFDYVDKITYLFNNLPKLLNAETSIFHENEIQVDTQADSLSQKRKS